MTKATLHLATAIIVWWKGLSNPRDYKFSTAQDPLLINADICKVERIIGKNTDVIVYVPIIVNLAKYNLKEIKRAVQKGLN